MDNNNPTEQVDLTFFPDVLKNLFDVTEKSDSEIEESLLSLPNFDVQYNKRKIVVSATPHPQEEA